MENEYWGDKEIDLYKIILIILITLLTISVFTVNKQIRVQEKIKNDIIHTNCIMQPNIRDVNFCEKFYINRAKDF